MFTLTIIIFSLLISSIFSIEQMNCYEIISYFPIYNCVKSVKLYADELNSFKIEKNDSYYILKVIPSTGPEIKDNKNLFYLKKFEKENFIVDIVDYKIVKDKIFIIRKFMEYGNLSKTLFGTNFFDNQNNILNFFHKILLGIKIFHDEAVVINNLTPQTILVDKSYEPKFFNFSKAIPISNKKYINDFHLLENTFIEGYHMFSKNGKKDIFDLGLILYYLINKEPLSILEKNIYKKKNNILKKTRRKKKYFFLKKGTLFIAAKIIEICLQNDEDKRYDVDKLINLIHEYNVENTYILKEDTKIYFDKIILVDPYNINIFIEFFLCCSTVLLFFIVIFYVFKKKLKVKKKSFDIDSSDLSNNIDKSSIDV